ncbi:F-box/kelch-repeat protein [Spatholobus suberectus]|nr:F-box/kelch-repeat protein [Spatholobus suberectus]
MAPVTRKNENFINNNNSIPHDLALNILSRLPVKSLNRLRCVHTSWSNLLENPQFMRMYLRNFLSEDNDGSLLLLSQQASEGIPNLFLVSGERFEKKVKLDWPSPCLEEDVINIKILDYCVNGTIGLIRYKRRYGDENVMLWNPATKEFRVIPSVLPQMQGAGFSVNIHGFGYDHVNDDYKLLQHAACFVDGSANIEKDLWQIYSLKRNSWKKLDLNMTRASRIWNPFGSAVNLNGSLHWWGSKHHDKGTEEDLLISFDVSNEVFHTTPIGWRTNSELVNRYLAVFNGSIAMISNSLWSNYLDISILGEVGVKESWTKLFTIGPLPCFGLPMGVGKKADIFFIKEDGELDCFDLSTQMSKVD